ncbi:HepT-like ribonuclease domain-containing protein [Candidatus Contubernalis alkaliaceticus]|uniref:HepT-like ribonuclease domain-containing protein n=1 Tax=Candidatus Contubernalis alkaliaceticus TaxID=338645 RepID=UPI001F4BEA54|nr:DUF86 domain-containing protein [Candidatus Contubernalis alkalaceticus]UNC93049.1 DUF86 domain-containing protein [Candidatus Contubernalis alkalaceticus]
MLNPDLVRIKHMIDASTDILNFTSGKSRNDLENNKMLSLSVVHLLEIIGEAASKISNNFRNKHDGIPWNSITGMRNRLIHGYYDVDLDIVWKTITNDIPPLLKELRNIVRLEE